MIAECTIGLDNKKIGVEEFLKKCSKAMIHEKYFKLVEAATERLEKSSPDDIETEEFDENIMAIFATSELPVGELENYVLKTLERIG